jgi:hypothetical protein
MMPELAREKKITFGAIPQRSAPTNGLTTSGCPISRIASSARRAAAAAPISGPIGNPRNEWCEIVAKSDPRKIHNGFDEPVEVLGRLG